MQPPPSSLVGPGRRGVSALCFNGRGLGGGGAVTQQAGPFTRAVSMSSVYLLLLLLLLALEPGRK